MKLFQKSALAVAIAAVPFLSVNAMEALDDAALSEMTGQAGVTIESQLDGQGITIEEIQYTDTGSGADGGGSINIQGIKIASASGDFTTIQKINVDEWGNLVTSSTTTGLGQTISVDSVELRSATQAASVDAATGAYAAGSTGAKLVTDLSMTTKSTGTSYTTILNLSDRDASATVDKVAANSAITYTAANTTDPDPLNHTAESYTYLAGTTAGTDTVDITKAINAVGSPQLAIVTNGSSQITNLDVGLLDGAIGIEGLKMHGGYNTAGDNSRNDLQSKQVIWAKGGNAYADAADVTAGRAAAVGDDLGGGVFIQGSDVKSYIEISKINIAGNNIGSVMINGMTQKGSVTRIYGH